MTNLPEPTEAQVQHACRELLHTLGWWTGNFSQGYRPGGRRHGTTRQTKGLPDFIAIHKARGQVLFWETKRPSGKRSPEQVFVGDLLLCTPALYGFGGLDELCAVLRTAGWNILEHRPPWRT